MKVWEQKQTGFTIVELLIVIVVIAILAAITIVGYQGIQQRAVSSGTASTIDSWDRILKAAGVEGATMPPNGSCLGKPGDYAARDGFVAGGCLLLDGADSGLAYSESHYSSWTGLAVKRSSGEMRTVSYNNGGTQMRARGVWVGGLSTATRTIDIRWLTPTVNQCGKGVPFGVQTAGSSTGYCTFSITY